METVKEELRTRKIYNKSRSNLKKSAEVIKIGNKTTNQLINSKKLKRVIYAYIKDILMYMLEIKNFMMQVEYINLKDMGKSSNYTFKTLDQ